jgi:DNA helicase HerA-like ATPase
MNKKLKGDRCLASIGIIFGKISSLNFRFAVSDSAAVKRSDYVKVWHESEGWTLAKVSSITRSSKNFLTEEAMDAAVGTSEIGNGGGQIIADATVIGVRDEDGVLRIPKPTLSPGDKVFDADELLIRQTLGLTHGDIFIGLLDGQTIHINLDANNLVQKHCSILAETGAGTSYTCGVIIEELLDKNIPLLIIDPHGEYSMLKFPNEYKPASFDRYGIKPKGYASQITVYTPASKLLNPAADALFRLNGINLGIKEFVPIFSEDISQNETEILFEAISKLKVEKQTYTIDDIIFEVGQNKSKIKWNVISKLEALRETGILSDKATSINELVQEGKASIIDMSGVNPVFQAMIVAKLCSDLFESRKLNTVSPCMIVLEEAHNFCPEKGPEKPISLLNRMFKKQEQIPEKGFEKAVSTDILRTIASWRDFGLGLQVVSQCPARVDKNILSQCNTQIILKVTNPNDLKVISEGLEGINSDIDEDIKHLSTGVAMITGTYIENPILVDIRTRKSRHGEASIPHVKESITENHITKNKKEIMPTQGNEIKTILKNLNQLQILRGYSLLPNNDIKFGIRLNNKTSFVIVEADIILDYPKNLFSTKDSEIQHLGNITPNNSRTTSYILKPLGCIHNEQINALITYKDYTGKKQTLHMRPKEVHCVCPFLKEKPMREGEYSRLAANSEYVQEGISFRGISIEDLSKFMGETCKHMLYKVKECDFENKKVIYLSGEALGEKAYYLLTAVIQDYKGLTQVVLRAHSDKRYGLNGFMNEIADSIRHLVGSVQNAKEIGIIENTQVVNIVDSVVQRTSFNMSEDGSTQVIIKESIVQRSNIGKKD